MVLVCDECESKENVIKGSITMEFENRDVSFRADLCLKCLKEIFRKLDNIDGLNHGCNYGMYGTPFDDMR